MEAIMVIKPPRSHTIPNSINIPLHKLVANVENNKRERFRTSAEGMLAARTPGDRSKPLPLLICCAAVGT